MTELAAPFKPDWVSPPGDSILDIIEERGWTQAELAIRLGYSPKHVNQLINGKVPLTDDAAVRLARVLGSTVSFWLTREARYRERLARLEAESEQAGWVTWLDELPLKELMAAGGIPKQRIDAKSKPGLVGALLSFFGVASPDEWRACYGQMQVAFRRTRAEQSDVGAIASWLRLGEQQAERQECARYERAQFEAALVEIRKLTLQPPAEFVPRLRGLLAEVGVVFVIVPAIPRAHVSGVARWLGPTRPLIQLSLYGKSNDKFWFSFFHEAAHILLHAGSKEDRKSVFLDDPNAAHTDDPREHEANEWAGNWLIPPQHAGRLSALRSAAEIEAFAREIDIHPAIVLGRLQHDGHVPYASALNGLRVSFQLGEAQDA